MIDRVDVDEAVEAAIAEHVEHYHTAPPVFMPVRSFIAELESDYAEEGTDPRCQVVGVTPHGNHEDQDGMPMLSFVVIADLGDGLIAPRIVPTLKGCVPRASAVT